MSIGLDIGSKTVKIVELGRDGSKFTLKSAAVVGYSGIDLSTLSQDQGSARELSDLAEVIKKLAHDAKISSKNIAISLPETQVFTRVMKFPLLNDQEIASAVKWEAEEYIPIPVKDAIIEHQILERIEVGNPPQVLVLLIAVLRSLVERYVKVVNMAGFNVIGVDTELMAAVRSTAPVDKTALVIDFGAQSTDIAIAKGEQLFFSRSIPTAGEAFTRAVGQSMGISLDQAEQYKRTYGLSEQLEGKVNKALSPIFKVVAEEIKKALYYYQLEVKADPATVVLLCGGTSGLPGASASLAKLLGLEVAIANPFSKIVISPESAQSLANFAPLYCVAVGLAMRGE